MIRTIFTDIGGVLLTNGWDRNSRKQLAGLYNLDLADLESRHHLTYDTYEIGKLSLDEYLDRIVFFQPRSFPRDEVRQFVYDQSQPLPEMLDLMRRLKARNNVNIVAVSNEGREVTEYRIRKFAMADFIDFFVSSCFVHFRKPDRDIFKMAIDMAQARPEESIYLDDRPLFVEIAASFGLHAIRHTEYAGSAAALQNLGLLF
jgi:putative hydrolase of the HAD superfamily